MIVKAHELLIAVKNILKDDQDITTWCQDVYGKLHNVYVGVNNEMPINKMKYPLIALFYVGRRRSGNVKTVAYEIELATAVNDSAVEDSGNTQTQMGILRVVEFRELVETAIEKSHLGKVDFNSDTWEENLFPLFTSNTLFQFERPANCRGPVR